MSARDQLFADALTAPPDVKASWVMTVALSFIFLAHLSYFAINVPNLTVETAPINRFISCALGLLSFLVLSKVLSAWTGDAIVGSSLPLALLLFPPTAFIYALFPPTAFLVFLFLVGVWLGTVAIGRARSLRPFVLGIVISVLPFIAAGGVYLSITLLSLVVVERPPKSFLIKAAGVSAVSAGVLSLFYPIVDTIGFDLFVVLPMQGLFANIVKPYAMLWLGLVFSLCALIGSSLLRQRISSVLARRLIVLGVGFGVAVLMLGGGSFKSDLGLSIAFNAILPLGVMLTLPMVLWMRFVMPQIKSVWIWILLPVVMYSCFWVVLGPVDLSAFPYDQVHRPSQP